MEYSSDEADNIKCALCRSTDEGPGNQIVLCDGRECRKESNRGEVYLSGEGREENAAKEANGAWELTGAYHQNCHYPPIFKIPQGKWFCRTCSVVEEEKKAKKAEKAAKSSDKSNGDDGKGKGKAKGRAKGEAKGRTKGRIKGKDSDDDDGRKKAPPLVARNCAQELSKIFSTAKTHLSKISQASDTIRAYTQSKRSQQLLKSGRIPSELLNARVIEARGKARCKELIMALDQYVQTGGDGIEVN